MTEKRKGFFPGMRQGYLRFDTLAHKILLHVYEHGPSTNCELQEALEKSSNEISAQLCVMRRYGFIYLNSPKARRSDGRLCYRFGLFENKHRKIPVLTPAERSRRYKERQKIKVPSVFQFRGSISL